jgi:hypothetical protein
MVLMAGTADFMQFTGFKLRRRWRLEVLRVWMQGGAICLTFAFMVSLMFAPLALEWPWHLPLRMYRDTFGNITDLLHLEPPLMDRRRFEREDNMWRPLTFPEKSAMGSLQDQVITLQNWGAENLFRGPISAKLLACMVCGVFAAPVLVAMKIAMSVFMLILQDPITQGYSTQFFKQVALWCPECVLIPDQLAMAKRAGRKLSPGAAADLAALSLDKDIETNPEEVPETGGSFPIIRMGDNGDKCA